jgi:hypothetical protein
MLPLSEQICLTLKSFYGNRKGHHRPDLGIGGVIVHAHSNLGAVSYPSFRVPCPLSLLSSLVPLFPLHLLISKRHFEEKKRDSDLIID